MKLYVGNLPFQATETDIQDWFAQSGVTVDSINIMRDRFSGEPRGFGFVEISNDEQAEVAIRVCNGKGMQGRNLVINEARPMAERGGGGGGGNRGGGGGGRGGRDSRGGGGGGGGRNRW